MDQFAAAIAADLNNRPYLYSYDLYSYGLYFYGLYSSGLYSHGLCSYGLCSYGLYSYGLHSYGLCSYGLYSYGLCSYGSKQAWMDQFAAAIAADLNNQNARNEALAHTGTMRPLTSTAEPELAPVAP